MASIGLDLPRPEASDHVQAMRDQYDAYIQKSLKWGQIRTDLLTKIAMAWLEGEGKLGEIVEQLTDAPIRDRWDLQGYLRHNGARDAKALGQQVLTLLAETVLEAVEAIDNEQLFQAQGELYLVLPDVQATPRCLRPATTGPVQPVRGSLGISGSPGAA